LNIAINRD